MITLKYKHACIKISHHLKKIKMDQEDCKSLNLSPNLCKGIMKKKSKSDWMCALCIQQPLQAGSCIYFVSLSFCGVYLYLLGSFEIMWPLLSALLSVMLACGSPQCRWLTAARQEGGGWKKKRKKISLSQSHRGRTPRCARSIGTSTPQCLTNLL